MRWKIIVVNAGIVVVVSLLSYVLLYMALTDVVANPAQRKKEVAQALRAANAQLALDALRFERWLAEQVTGEGVRGVFSGGVVDARRESATAEANKLRDAAVAEAAFAKMAPALVLFVDSSGVALGRNGSALMRGDKMGEFYPSLLESLKSGRTMSEIWSNRERQEQLLASYAPVRNAEGEITGAVIVGTPLSDERLLRTSELTSGQVLMLGVNAGKGIELVASSAKTAAAVTSAGDPAVSTAAQGALSTGNVTSAESEVNGFNYGAVPLDGYGNGRRAILIAAVPASLVASVGGLLWPVFAVGALGVVLVFAGGVLLGNYISRPISEIEDGLLAIINGSSDLRFQLEHAELGGLVFRINSLLNALMGVPEDTTDDQGRSSRPHSEKEFRDAIAVDEGAKR
jgi:hypothetical protein